MTRWLVPEELGHYEPLSRSMRIEGYSTSVRLERVFWEVLDQIAASRSVSTCGLVGEIYREVHSAGEPFNNFSSVLRVICLHHLECGAAGLPLPRRAPEPLDGGAPRPKSAVAGHDGDADRSSPRADDPALRADWGIGPLR